MLDRVALFSQKPMLEKNRKQGWELSTPILSAPRKINASVLKVGIWSITITPRTNGGDQVKDGILLINCYIYQKFTSD